MLYSIYDILKGGWFDYIVDCLLKGFEFFVKYWDLFQNKFWKLCEVV